MEEEELYPIYYEDRYWDKEDCDEMFVSFYHNKHSLNWNCGVYVNSDMWVYPCGYMESY